MGIQLKIIIRNLIAINIDIYKFHIYEQIKTHDIAGRMFEDEHDLVLAIMDGMEARSVKGGYILERFKFNSA